MNSPHIIIVSDLSKEIFTVLTIDINHVSGKKYYWCLHPKEDLSMLSGELVGDQKA